MLENTEGNHNKFYHFELPPSLQTATRANVWEIDPNHETFKVKYGPIGKKPRFKEYLLRELCDKYDEKIGPRKGYTIKFKETANGHSCEYNAFMDELGDDWAFTDD
jgi:hypothetical protein